MKLLFATGEKSVRGGHIVLTALVRELNKQKIKSSVVVTVGQEHRGVAGLATLWRGVPTTAVRIKKFSNPDERDWSKIQAVEGYLTKRAKVYDWIVVDGWHMSYAAMLAGVESKTIQLTQSYPAFKPESAAKIWRAAYFDLLPRVLLKRIVVSNYLAAELQKIYGQHASVMHPFIDQAYFVANFAYREAAPLKFIATASTWTPGIKGLDFLLTTLERFGGYPFELTLVSSEPLVLDRKAKFPVHITSAASPKEMAHLLISHDIYLSVSTNEAFHMSLAQAMAIGMPVVTLDSGGNRDYVRQGKNALLAHNKKDFIIALKRLKSVSMRKRLGVAAQKSVRAFTLQHMVEQFKKALKQ